MQTQASSISVIIEWKNQNYAADDRAYAMLTRLRDQWLAICNSNLDSESSLPMLPVETCLEILFVYDSTDSRQNLSHLITEHFGTYADFFVTHLINGAGLTYYQMKLHGANQASGNILVFLDSDVIPDPGWFESLLKGVFTDGVQIVFGNTYIDPTGLLGKAFALGWFFPLRSTSVGLEVGKRGYSNNIALSRELFLRYPFDPISGTTRSGMSSLLRTLEAAGIPVHKCHDAQVSHPAPNGFIHMIRRAMAHGRDIYLKSSHESGGTGNHGRLAGALQNAWDRYTSGVSRTVRQYDQVELSPVMVPVILTGITFYYLSFATASLLTHVAPKPMSRWFQL